MNKLLLLCFLLIVIPFYGQDTIVVDAPVIPPAIVVKAPFGEEINFGSYALKLIDVVDSRCPSDATCIWAGEVTATVEVYQNGKFVETKKVTFPSKTNTYTLLSDETINLSGFSVFPYPSVKNGKINKADYVLNLTYKLD